MKSFLSCLSFVIAQFCLLPATVFSADFSVNPVRISFEAGQKTTALTVRNNSDEPLALQLSVVAWSQDDGGKDVYSKTEDVVAFPLIFKIKKDEQQIIRIGVTVPAGQTEKTYRLYLEELPPPQDKEERTGAFLRTLMKVGVPIFFAPLKPATEGGIGKPLISGRTLSFSVFNKGNLHFLVTNIAVRGFDKKNTMAFEADLGGWYILQGGSKKFSVDIPPETCSQLDEITMEVSAHNLSLRESLNVSPESCAP